jgi:hypothetical protein
MVEEIGQEDRQYRHSNAGDDSNQGGDQAGAGWHDEDDDDQDEDIFYRPAEGLLGLLFLDGLADTFGHWNNVLAIRATRGGLVASVIYLASAIGAGEGIGYGICPRIIHKYDYSMGAILWRAKHLGRRRRIYSAMVSAGRFQAIATPGDPVAEITPQGSTAGIADPGYRR